MRSLSSYPSFSTDYGTDQSPHHFFGRLLDRLSIVTEGSCETCSSPVDCSDALSFKCAGESSDTDDDEEDAVYPFSPLMTTHAHDDAMFYVGMVSSILDVTDDESQPLGGCSDEGEVDSPIIENSPSVVQRLSGRRMTRKKCYSDLRAAFREAAPPSLAPRPRKESKPTKSILKSRRTAVRESPFEIRIETTTTAQYSPTKACKGPRSPYPFMYSDVDAQHHILGQTNPPIQHISRAAKLLDSPISARRLTSTSMDNLLALGAKHTSTRSSRTYRPRSAGGSR